MAQSSTARVEHDSEIGILVVSTRSRSGLLAARWDWGDEDGRGASGWMPDGSVVGPATLLLSTGR
jgi:hypothetical protein